MCHRLLPLSLCLLLAIALPAAAAPITLAMQGRLGSSAGGPVADGTYPMGIALYGQEKGGAAGFTELFLAVPVQNGVFATTLGTATTALDAELIVAGKASWIGITVGGDPEMARVVLHRVPLAVHSLVSADVQCSGCVGADDLAAGAVTADKIGAGTIQSSHLGFGFAGSDAKGGAATSALSAKKADFAAAAGKADAAVTAEEAKVAFQLQCTGCVTSAMLADDVAGNLVAQKKLAAVAVSGAYKDLSGGPDLTPYALTGTANAWPKQQALNGGLALGADAQFNLHQANLFRFQNADKEPVPCDANATGLAYYNTADQALYVCNGKAFKMFAKASTLGAQGNPGASCKAILDAGDATGDGLYWLKPLDTPFQAYCDMTTDGGGWTRFLHMTDAAAYVGLQGVANAQEYVSNGTFQFSKTLLKASDREVLVKEAVAPFRRHRYDFKQGSNLQGEDFVGALTGDVGATVAVWNQVSNQWQSMGNGACNGNNHSQWNCTPPTGIRFHYATRDWTGNGGSDQNTGWAWFTGYNTGYGDYGVLVKTWDGQYNTTAHDFFVR